ncbi:MAG: recombinase family protein, partial [Candidatus Eremiobacteraeota bacterium]|nr:recombinase family protein [Candidatus Eremiobacteraeota bacterium]
MLRDRGRDQRAAEFEEASIEEAVGRRKPGRPARPRIAPLPLSRRKIASRAPILPLASLTPLASSKTISSRARARRTVRAVLYARVSTDAQRDKGLSIPSQIKEMERFCRANNWEIQTIYKDEGYTGTNSKRPGFAQMLELALSPDPPFDVIVCWALDRFGRSAADALYKEQIRQNNVAIHYVSENMGSGDDFMIQEGFSELMSRHYIHNLRKVVPRGQREAVRQGKFGTGGDPNFGYNNEFSLVANRRVRRLVPDKETAPIIKEIFKRYAGGASISSITRWLTSFTPTPAKRLGRKPRGATSNVWLDGTVWRILQNEVYLGSIVYGRRSVLKNSTTGKARERKNPREEWEVYEGGHEPLVSGETFSNVQLRLATNEQTRPRPGRPPNILSGIGRCKA